MYRSTRTRSISRVLPLRRVRFCSLKSIILSLAVLALLPPIVFHFRLRRFHQIQLRRCGWLRHPPLVCAHGGDPSNASPNTMAAYLSALHSGVDCIEIDVSRSSDGVLFALHDRDLQRLSGNTSSRVGYFTSKQIRELSASRHSMDKSNDGSIPTIQDALMLTANSVRQIILDVKVGPPLYEKGLAQDILSIVEKTECRNCLIWSKSDNLARDVVKLSSEIAVGYIVMREPSTGARTKLLRMKGAEVVGVYHPLIDEKLMRVLHRCDFLLKHLAASSMDVWDLDSLHRENMQFTLLRNRDH